MCITRKLGPHIIQQSIQSADNFESNEEKLNRSISFKFCILRLSIAYIKGIFTHKYFI